MPIWTVSLSFERIRSMIYKRFPVRKQRFLIVSQIVLLLSNRQYQTAPVQQVLQQSEPFLTDALLVVCDSFFIFIAAPGDLPGLSVLVQPVRLPGLTASTGYPRPAPALSCL